MSNELRVRSDCLQLYLCTQMPCTQNLVHLKIHATDVATRELNGPELAQALRGLVAEKGLGEQVEVRETCCMRGCLVGPRLNVVGTGGFKDAVRYLHLPATKRPLRCAPWGEVASVEDLLDRHVQGRPRRPRGLCSLLFHCAGSTSRRTTISCNDEEGAG